MMATLVSRGSTAVGCGLLEITELGGHVAATGAHGTVQSWFEDALRSSGGLAIATLTALLVVPRLGTLAALSVFGAILDTGSCCGCHEPG